MYSTQSIVIMKFGGAALATAAHFDHIASIIKAKQAQHLVIVVSAMQQKTNELIDLAQSINPCPPQREYDMLISVGERISMSLLAMALAKHGIQAISLTGSQSGIITCNKHSNARIIDVRPQRIIQAFKQKKIAIVAGFQGVSCDKEITTLGRGGSDTTAVALGIALNADVVEFYKDVPGIYSQDPKIDTQAEFFEKLSFTQAITILDGAKILHSRALLMAQYHNMRLHVLPFMHNGPGTIIDECIPLVPNKLYENYCDISCVQ